MAKRITFPVTIEVLEWVEHRSQKTEDELTEKFPKYPEWKAGTKEPTMTQLENLADFTYTPFAYLLQSEPQDESRTYPDFRSNGVISLLDLNPNLRDVIFWAGRRQVWMEEYSKDHNYPKLSWIGKSDKEDTLPENAAKRIHELLSSDFLDQKRPQEFMKLLVDSTENARVMVNISGTVGSNTNRVLDIDVFRGFSLTNDYAPLIFINGRDSHNAQLFTLIHEWGHLLIGKPGIDNPRIESQYTNRCIESWCNEVAGNFLVPSDELQQQTSEVTDTEINRLSRYFQVSRLTIIIRMKDLNMISRDLFQNYYNTALYSHNQKKQNNAKGGDFYHTHKKRVGKLFARTILADALAFQTPFTEATQLLGIKYYSLDRFAEVVNKSV